MKDVVPLGERLTPDTIVKLERAAQDRFTTAEILRTENSYKKFNGQLNGCSAIRDRNGVSGRAATKPA